MAYEGQNGFISKSDFIIDTELTSPPTLPKVIYNKVAFIGTKESTAGIDVNGQWLAQGVSAWSNFEETGEVSNYTGSVLAFNTADLTAPLENGLTALEVMNSEVSVVVVSLNRLADWIALRAQSTPLANFKPLVMLTIDVDSEYITNTIAEKQYGAMLDESGQGKALFTITWACNKLPATNAIIGKNSDSFDGVINIADSNKLKEDGYSFYAKGIGDTWLNSFQFGKVQAQRVLVQRVVLYEAKTALTYMLTNGVPYTDAGVTELVAGLDSRLDRLVKARIIDEVLKVSILPASLQSANDKKLAKIKQALISYRSLDFIESISITINRVDA